MEATGHDYRRYLDPRVLARISSLELRARLIVEGFFSGMHHSPHHGASVEFADHRVYVQGDDLRHIDWKVYGRTDKYYIKEYEQETNLNLVLVVDASESMAYRSAGSGMSKYEYASAVAASIAYLTLQQQDAVGLARFDDRLRDLVRPSTHAQQWKSIVHELALGPGGAKTSLQHVLDELTERISRRMMVIVLSDLLDDPEAVLRGCQHLRFGRHELLVWCFWDRAELTFPFLSPTRFEGLEGQGRVLGDPKALQHRYLDEVDRFQSRLRAGFAHLQIDYTLFDTSAPLDAALSGYLATRRARLRQHSAWVIGTG